MNKYNLREIGESCRTSVISRCKMALDNLATITDNMAAFSSSRGLPAVKVKELPEYKKLFESIIEYQNAILSEIDRICKI